MDAEHRSATVRPSAATGTRRRVLGWGAGAALAIGAAGMAPAGSRGLVRLVPWLVGQHKDNPTRPSRLASEVSG